MRQLSRWILACCLACALLFVMCHGWSYGHTEPPTQATSISTLPNDALHVALWEPPNRKLELVTLPSSQHWTARRVAHDATLVRPAWGMFVAMVCICLYILANVRTGGLVIPLF